MGQLVVVSLFRKRAGVNADKLIICQMSGRGGEDCTFLRQSSAK